MACAAINCDGKNHSEEKLFFFRFPRDLDLCKLWVLSVRRFELFKEEPSTLHHRYKICSQHFLRDLIFMKNGNPYLVNNAVPTMFDFPCIQFSEPPAMVQTDDMSFDNEHGYSMPLENIPRPILDYSLLTRVVEIKAGSFFVSGGALLHPGTIKNGSFDGAKQVGVLLGIVRKNKIREVTWNNVNSCYLQKSVLQSKPGKYWLKRFNGQFPPGDIEFKVAVSYAEFYKGLSIDNIVLNDLADKQSACETQNILTLPPKFQSPFMKNCDEPPPLSAPQRVLLLSKKRAKKQVITKKEPSVVSCHSGSASLNSLLAIQCDQEHAEPVASTKPSSFPVTEEDKIDLEYQKCTDWIEKHSTFFSASDSQDEAEDKPEDKENTQLIVELSNAPISDTLKCDLVTYLAENKDQTEVDTVLDGKPIKATKQRIKIPLDSVDSGSLGDIRKCIEEVLNCKQTIISPATNDAGMSVKRKHVETVAEEPGPSKKLQKVPVPSRIPAHIREILKGSNDTLVNMKPSPPLPNTKPTVVPVPLRNLQEPCQKCLERAKEKPPPPKIHIKPLREYPEYILLKKQFTAAKRKIHKLEKTNAILKERVRNPPKIKVERVLEEIQKYLTVDAYTLVQSTVMHSAKDTAPHGNRFSDQVKNLGYRLMLSGVQVYKCFAHIFNLPCTTTMKKWISQHEKKHIDSLFGLNTNKGENIGAYVDEEEEDEGEKEGNDDDDIDLENEAEQHEEQQNTEDHSYTEKSILPVMDQAEENQESTVVPSQAFLARAAEGGIILEDGDETYEIQENGEVAALEVILDDGEEVPLQIPLDQFYALQQHYVIET